MSLNSDSEKKLVASYIVNVCILDLLKQWANSENVFLSYRQAKYRFLIELYEILKKTSL